MRRVLQVILITAIIGFVVSSDLILPGLPPDRTDGGMASPAPSHAAYPLPPLVCLCVSVCCMLVAGPLLARTRKPTPGRAVTEADTVGPEDGGQGALRETSRRLDGLSALPEAQSPTAEALRRARVYIADVGHLLSAEGVTWRVPEVSTGRSGSVVLLWQEGGSYLSLSFRDADQTADSGLAEWVIDPGKSYGDVVMLDFTHTLQRGSSAPAEFADAVWRRWRSGQAPLVA